MIDEERLKKMRACICLLPDPGYEVARELIDEIDRLREALVAAEKAIQEAASDMVGYCGKDPEQLAEPLRRAADASVAIRAALAPNVLVSREPQEMKRTPL